jgi:uncharacterized membrane protein
MEDQYFFGEKEDKSVPEDAPGSSEPVWTYRGYKLKASEFTTSMVHLFRAEVQRANLWRSRLDATTNWAVVSTGATISIAFSQGGSNHAVILVNILLVTTFLIIEARRYRYYELWSYRVRLMETDFFAAMLVPPFQPSPEWSEALAESLLHPQFPISNLEAIGRRLRRNYLYIYGIIGAAWMVKLWLFPDTARNWSVVSDRAAVGAMNGTWIIIGMFLFYIGLIILSISTARLQQSAGEVLPRFGGHTEPGSGGIIPGKGEAENQQAWFRPVHRRKQLLTLIITDRAKDVSEQVIREMKRGVTALDGVGMFTGKTHKVLLCALTVTEVPHLKALVNSVDANAFIIVSPAQEILGRGFSPLTEE